MISYADLATMACAAELHGVAVTYRESNHPAFRTGTSSNFGSKFHAFPLILDFVPLFCS